MLPASAEMREFKSAQGSVLRAELKKVKGANIFLTKEDGKEISVPLTGFSKEDQSFILKAMVDDPTVLDYNFGVRIEEKTQEGTKRTNNRYYERVSAVSKAYAVSIVNSSRNTLDDVTVDWCTFMMDRVTVSNYGSYYSSSSYGNSYNGVLRAKLGTEVIKKMEPSHSSHFTTSPVSIESLIEKYYYSGSGKIKDTMQGAWLRFYRKGVLISEWKSPDCPKTAWPGVVRVTQNNNIAANPAKPIPSKPVPRPPVSQPSSNTSNEPESDPDSGDIIKVFQLEN